MNTRRQFERLAFGLLLVAAVAFGVWGSVTQDRVEIAHAQEATPDVRIVDVRAEYGQMVVEVQHFHPDGSHWFFEHYTYQGRQYFQRPWLLDAEGFPQLASGGRAQLRDGNKNTPLLRTGESLLRENRPHLEDQSVFDVIQMIHAQRLITGWTHGAQRLTTSSLDSSFLDRAGASPLVSRFQSLIDQSYILSDVKNAAPAFLRTMAPTTIPLGDEHGTVSVFNPEDDDSFDGYARRAGVDESWATIRAGAGTANDDTGTVLISSVQIAADGSGFQLVFRVALLFDTSAIGDSDVIDSAVFEVVATSLNDDFTDSITLTTSTPSSNTEMENTDYLQFGTTKQASDKTMGSLTVDSSTFTSFTLNAAGEASISLTGTTKFALRNTSDNDNDEPSGAANEYSQLNMASAEEALSGDKRPRLTVTHSTITAVITGTIGDGATEQEVRDGAGKIIITIAGATWNAAGSAFDDARQAIIDGLDAAESEAAGWNAEVRDQLNVTSVVRTSNTIATVTTSASDVIDYNISNNETLTVTVPDTAISIGSPITATPTIAITAASESAAVTGTLGGSGGTPAEIVAGGETVIIELDNTAWVASGATFNAQRQAILDGLESAQTDQNGWDSLAFAVGDVVRTSGSIVTITLTAESAYAIPAAEAITVTVPAAAIGGAALIASPAYAITPSFQTSGTRVSGAIDLSSVTDVAYCALGWVASVPSNTAVSIATSVDGGANYSSATNGSCPTGLTVGESLATITDFRVRVALSTTDTSTTPLIEALGLIVEDASGQEVYYQLNTTPGFTITDRSGNSHPGTMSMPTQTSGVTTSLGEMSSTEEGASTATALGIPEVASAVTGSAVSSKIFETTEDGSFLPGGGLVSLSAANSGIPARAIWQVLFGITILVGASIVVKFADGNMMWGGVALSLGIAFGALVGEDGIWPRWMIFIAPIPMMAMIRLNKGVPM